MVPMAPSMTAMRWRRSARRACPRSLAVDIRCSLSAGRRSCRGMTELATPLRPIRPTPLFVRRFGQQPLVYGAGVVVGLARGGTLGLPDAGSLLRPALVDGGEAPAGAPPRGADGPVPHHHEDRVGVGGRPDARRHPAALLD